jgi:hypothetical protein
MYQLNETEIWREHHREAEGGHLAWRQKVVHTGRKETLTSAMRRSAAFLLSTMGWQCSWPLARPTRWTSRATPLPRRAPASAPTPRTSTSSLALTAATRSEAWVAPTGSWATGRRSRATRSSVAPAVTNCSGTPAPTFSREAKAVDEIAADFLVNDGTDTVQGGSGNDIVNATEGAKDVIDCGKRPGQGPVRRGPRQGQELQDQELALTTRTKPKANQAGQGTLKSRSFLPGSGLSRTSRRDPRFAT